MTTTFGQPGEIVDLYAGPGGWSEGLRKLGLTDIGFELDKAACSTRAAAGHRTIRCDIAAYPTAPLKGKVWGLIASPPCQTLSLAGKGEGRDEIERLAQQAYRGDWDTTGLDDRTKHVLVIGRWMEELDPEWICLEQVPPVLPVWRAYAHWLRGRGYSVWTGKVNAADYGVPQTRKRAVLVASKVRGVTAPPITHSRNGGEGLDLFDLPRWISMAEALGWGMTRRPSTTVVAKSAGGGDAIDGGTGSREARQRAQDEGDWVPRVGFPRRDDRGGDGYRERDMREITEPAPAVTSKARSWIVDDGAEPVDPPEWTTERPATTVCASNPGIVFPHGGGPDVSMSQRGYFPWGEDEPIIVDTRRDVRDGQTQTFDATEEPARTVTGARTQWVVSTGMNSMKHSRDPNDMVPFERSVDEPAPTIDTKANRWKVGEPGHRQPPMSWKDKDDAAPSGWSGEVDPIAVTYEQCADPTTCSHRTHGDGGGQLALDDAVVLNPGATESQPNRRRYSPDEPAPTVAFGHDTRGWAWEQPTATISVSIEDVLVLQSFRRDYPLEGSRTKKFEQVGNAVPPLLAAHVASAATGRPILCPT